MKQLLTLSSLLISVCLFAQYAPGEIKKFNISRIITFATTKGLDAIQKNEIWYDDNGNDTAEYHNGELFRRTKYEFNTKGEIIVRIRSGADGKETETAVYTYNPDGSCIVSNTDKSFGMTDLTFCDKTGKTTKTVAPDKTERIHIYDAKGKLIKIKSSPSDSGAIITDIQYSYNPKGQMIRELSKGDYKWTSIFSYDYRGLIARVKRDAVTDGVTDPEVNYTYEYGFRK